MLLKIWPNAASYNDTLVFHSDTPYDFGEYDGQRHAPTLITRLAAHAAEFVHHAGSDAWYITTAGWPWAATLTSGEAAVAPLRWDGGLTSVMYVGHILGIVFGLAPRMLAIRFKEEFLHAPA